ncbi:hypothetical protein Plhal703r1_c35g0130471 [Plasmopara halstedii]
MSGFVRGDLHPAALSMFFHNIWWLVLITAMVTVYGVQAEKFSTKQSSKAAATSDTTNLYTVVKCSITSITTNGQVLLVKVTLILLGQFHGLFRLSPAIAYVRFRPVHCNAQSPSRPPFVVFYYLYRVVSTCKMDPDHHLRIMFDSDGHKLVELPTGGRVAVPYDPLCEAERAAAEAARAINPPDELRCRYKSTRCNNLRAQKRSGNLHSLCQMHRDRANQNQRNSELRKRSGEQFSRSRQRSLVNNQENVSFNRDNLSDQTMLNSESPQIPMPEPLQGTDGLHLEPTYDELKETAMLLSYDRDQK